MKKITKQKSALLFFLMSAAIGFAIVHIASYFSFSAYDKNQNAFRNLVQNLRLTNDAAQPSELVSDEGFRTRLQNMLSAEAAAVRCSQVQTQWLGYDTKSYAHLYKISYYLGLSTVPHDAILRMPDNRSNLPVAIYASSGLNPVVSFDEPSQFLSNSINSIALVMPLFYGESFQFNGSVLTSTGSLLENDLFSESQLISGLAHCLQNRSMNVALYNGGALSNYLLRAYGEHGGYRLALIGSGRGSLLVSQAAARTGASFLAGTNELKDVAHIDAVVAFNPLQSLVSAEGRLWLASLVRGNIKETKYGFVTGVNGFDASIAGPYRAGQKSLDEVTLQVALRDSNILAPFINIGIKNFAFPSNDKGFRAGAMLILQGLRRGDFTANGSRIFSNVMSTVQFATTEQTNGMNLLYREVPESDGDASRLAYKNIVSPSYLTARTQRIDDVFIVFSDSTKDKQKFYRWLMRGRAFVNVGENRPSIVAHDFLIKTLGIQ